MHIKIDISIGLDGRQCKLQYDISWNMNKTYIVVNTAQQKSNCRSKIGK
jgi:hypothetical protein